MDEKTSYQESGEGAVYARRKISGPMTAEEMEENQNAPFLPPPDNVIRSQELALEVLLHFYGEGVTLSDRHESPKFNGELIQPPEVLGPGPEIIHDVFELLDLAHSVKTLVRCLRDERFKDTHHSTAQNLANTALAVGQWHERVRIRWEGIEKKVDGKDRQVRNLVPCKKRANDKQSLINALAKAKHRKPQAGKTVLIKVAAEYMDVSPSTIKRRMNEYKIKSW